MNKFFIMAISALMVALSTLYSDAKPFAYVTNSDLNTVSVIDTETKTLLPTDIPVGTLPFEIAATPDGREVWVSNRSSNTISVINTVTKMVITIDDVGSTPLQLAIDPNGEFAYVPVSGGEVLRYNTTTKIKDVKSVAVGNAVAVAFIFKESEDPPGRNLVYVAQTPGNSVSVIDATTFNSVEKVIGLTKRFALLLTASPNGQYIYVPNNLDDTISVINTSTNEVDTTIPTGRNPLAVAITPDGKYAFVTLVIGEAVEVIDINPLSLDFHKNVLTIRLDIQPEGIAITPDGQSAYVMQPVEQQVSVIDVASVIAKIGDTNPVFDDDIDTIPIPRDPDPDKNFPFRVAIVDAPEPLTTSCIGFEPPMDGGPVTVKKNRVLPFKAVLQDIGGNPITNLDLLSPPVIQVLFSSDIPSAEDVTDQALSSGQGTEGNQFEFGDDKWQFNLKTKNYTAAGTYIVSIVSGDETEYVLDPSCVGTFVIE